VINEDFCAGSWGPLVSEISAWWRAGCVTPFMVRQGILWEPGRLTPRRLDTPVLLGRCLPGVRR
jgi:hypothetical protein